MAAVYERFNESASGRATKALKNLTDLIVARNFTVMGHGKTLLVNGRVVTRLQA